MAYTISDFLGNVVWHPSATTRILHVGCGVNNHVSHIKLCVSSDNNNSVFVRLPVTWLELERIVADEISLHARSRLAKTYGGAHSPPGGRKRQSGYVTPSQGRSPEGRPLHSWSTHYTIHIYFIYWRVTWAS